MASSTSIDTAASLAHKATLGGAAVSGLGGWWTWMGEHSQQLGVIFAAIGALCAVIGLCVNIWRGRKK